MDKELTSVNSKGEYVPHNVMELGSLSDRKLTGTWKDYVSVTKVGIIVSNLLTVVTGMWLAAITSINSTSVLTVLLTLLGTAFIIASGTCLNNYIDRDIDQKMQRTKKRALVEGRLHPKNVLLMGIILAILGTALLLFVNVMTTMVALVGLLGYVGLYTLWSKRTHSINTIVGSISGAVPPMIGWTAISGSLDVGAWILFAIVFLWQPPHFLALAMRRCEDYRAAGIPMLPVISGFHETKRQMIRYVAALIPVSLLLFFLPNVGWAYVIMALVLGLTWLGISIMGFFTKDDIRWSRIYFFYSLIYLTVMFVGMIVVTI